MIRALLAVASAAGRLVVSVDAGRQPVVAAEAEVRPAGGDTRIASAPVSQGSNAAFQLAPGLYEVEIHAKTLPFASVHDVVVRGGQEFPLHVDLALGPRRALVEGTVIDDRGRPLGGALVAGWTQTVHFGVPTSPGRVHTDASGTFRVATLPDEDVTVQARTERGVSSPVVACVSFRGCSANVAVVVPAATRALRGRDRPLEWTAPPSYLERKGKHLHVRIEGVSTDAQFALAILPISRREPIPSHALAWSEGCLECEDPGLPWQRFVAFGDEVDLDGVPDEAIDVRAESSAGIAETQVLRGSREVVLTVAGTGVVRGRALHESDNPVLEGRACLSVPGNGDVLRCVAIENGRFQFSRLAPGQVRLTVSALGMVSAVRDVDVPPSPPVDVGTLVLPDERPSRP